MYTPVCLKSGLVYFCCTPSLQDTICITGLVEAKLKKGGVEQIEKSARTPKNKKASVYYPVGITLHLCDQRGRDENCCCPVWDGLRKQTQNGKARWKVKIVHVREY